MKLVYFWPLVYMVQLVLLYGVQSSSVLRQRGNLTVAAFLPAYQSTETDHKNCSDHLEFKGVVEIQAVMYAVNKVNSDVGLLNGTTLGYDIETTCEEDPWQVFNRIKAMLNREAKPPSAMLLDLPHPFVQLVANSERMPVLSLGAIPANRQGGVFYLEPAQSRISDAILKLIGEFNWTVLDVLVENAKEYESFKSSIKTDEVCVNNVFHAMQNFSETFYGRDDGKAPLLVFSKSLDILNQLPSGFLDNREIVVAGDSLDVGENRNRSDPLKVIAVGRKRAQLRQFQDYFLASAKKNESWLAEILGNESQDCASLGNDACRPLPERLSRELRYAGKAIDAVYAVAHALAKTQANPLTDKHLTTMSTFTSPTGIPVRFTSSKDLWEVDYDVVSVAEMQVLAGTLKTFPKTGKTAAELNLEKIAWNTKTRGHPNSSCVITCPEEAVPIPSTQAGPFAKCCVTCQENNSTVCENGRRWDEKSARCVAVRLDYLRPRDPVSIVIMILVALLFCFLVYLVNLFVKKAHTPTILTTKLATVPLLLSLFLTLILPLLPILKPGPSACNAYVFGYVQGLGIPLCILISRSYSYSKRFRTEDGALKRKLCHGDPQNVIAVVLILIQLLLSLVFIFVLPAHVVRFETEARDVDYIECSIFSNGVFLFPFFYTIILTIVFSVKNFRAVTREEDIYESNFAALSIFGFYFLSFLTLVVLYSVHGKTKMMLVCVIAFLHVLDYFLLIFFPKVYVIVFKRDPSSFSPFPLPERIEYLITGDFDSKEDLPSS